MYITLHFEILYLLNSGLLDEGEQIFNDGLGSKNTIRYSHLQAGKGIAS